MGHVPRVIGITVAIVTVGIIVHALKPMLPAGIRGQLLPMNISSVGMTTISSPTDELWLDSTTFAPLAPDLGGSVGGATAGTPTTFGVPYGGTTGGGGSPATCGNITDPRTYDVNPCRCARDDADASRLQGMVASLAQNALGRVCNRVDPSRNGCPAPCIKKPGVDPNPYVANEYGPQVVLTGKYGKGTAEYRKAQCGSTKNLVACFHATGTCDVITECRGPIGAASASSQSPQFTNEYWCCKPPAGKTSTYCTQRTSCYYEGEVRSGPFTDRTTCEDGCEPLGLFKCCSGKAAATCAPQTESCPYGLSDNGGASGYRDCQATCKPVPSYYCCEGQTSDTSHTPVRTCASIEYDKRCPVNTRIVGTHVTSDECRTQCVTPGIWSCCDVPNVGKQCRSGANACGQSANYGTYPSQEVCQQNC